jgi:hypothetical protein
MQYTRNTGVPSDAVQQHEVSQSKHIDGTHENSLVGNTGTAIFVNKNKASML